jgi:hypothetical protein
VSLAADLAADLRHALDPAAFAAEALGFTPDDWQARALRSTARRSLWLCARQTGKSSTAATLATHEAVFTPGSLTLLISPSERQSVELARKVRAFIDRTPAGGDLLVDNVTSIELANRSRVVSLPSSESTIRGFSGPSLVIEDEASRVADTLHHAVTPMLATSNGRMVLMSTPFGTRGHFHALWTGGGPAWERTRVTAHDCPRIPATFLEEERRTMPDWFFRSEYLVEFMEDAGAVFRYEDIQAALSDGVAPLFGGSQ